MERPLAPGETLPPPTERITVLGWIYRNLLSPWYNAVLTVLGLALAYALLVPVLRWALTQAEWQVVVVNLRLFMVGQYPKEALWRVWLLLYLLALTAGWSWGVLLGKRYATAGFVLLGAFIGLAVLPFAPALRFRWFTLALTALVAWGLAYRWRAAPWARKVAFALLLLYFPIVIIVIRGFAGWDRARQFWAALYLTGVLAGLVVGMWRPERRWPAARWGQLGLFLVPLSLALLPTFVAWRFSLVGLAAVTWAAWLTGRSNPTTLRGLARVLVGLYLPLLLLLYQMGPSGLLVRAMPQVGTNLWGGLLLTFLLTIVGIVFSFPLGILLALGRRSMMPAIRLFSILYIEFIRGVPLVTILFMAQVMLPLFLPPGMTIDRVLRAMAGIVLFAAAYMAENVRGGLQAIPKGQYEAAYALGLNAFQAMTLIILPQALRNVIPVIVNQFIALFKDTSLVAIVGLFDLLGIASTVLAQPQFIGKQREVYTFIGLIYWIFSYGMSYTSRQIEKALGVGER